MGSGDGLSLGPIDSMQGQHELEPSFRVPAEPNCKPTLRRAWRRAAVFSRPSNPYSIERGFDSSLGAGLHSGFGRICCPPRL